MTKVIDSVYIARQVQFSQHTFGPDPRTEGVVDHLRSELDEVLADPDDPSEWADLIILAIDGATRRGIRGQTLIDAVHAKLAKNEARVWPDWRTADPTKRIEHDRSHD